MPLSRLVLIPVLFFAQVCSAACGRSLFVWCLGPHGELKLELPHESCRHDCEDETPVQTEPIVEDVSGAGLVDPHGCDDVPADMTVPAMRRPWTDSDLAPAPDPPTPDLVAWADRALRPIPGAVRARSRLDRPPSALRVLRTVRLII